MNTTTEEPEITTEKPLLKDDFKYLIVPLIVIVVVMFLSILVYFMLQKRRENILKHRLLSLYDVEENTGEEWENLNSYEYTNYASNDYTTTVF